MYLIVNLSTLFLIKVNLRYVLFKGLCRSMKKLIFFSLNMYFRYAKIKWKRPGTCQGSNVSNNCKIHLF